MTANACSSVNGSILSLYKKKKLRITIVILWQKLLLEWLSHISVNTRTSWEKSISSTYRALLTCFMNELGASGEQIDSFRESNLDWIFAKEFSHTIWESTQVFTNVTSLPFTTLETKRIWAKQHLAIACKIVTGNKIASRLLFCPSNSPTSHCEMILVPGFSILVCKVANKGFLTWVDGNKITSISIRRVVIK